MVSVTEIKKIFLLLEKEHQPTMLEQFKNYTHFQILVMTLLSSRTKDSFTIPLVRKLFKKYPKPQDFIKLDLGRLEKELYGIGFYRVKAKQIKKLSGLVLEKFKGKIPDYFNELVKLPGVGRKTANCVLSYVFNKPAIAVDVHVHRIANRLGWIKTSNAGASEEELQKIVPQELWFKVNQLFVDHGQRVCLPVKPRCSVCSVRDWCEYGWSL